MESSVESSFVCENAEENDVTIITNAIRFFIMLIFNILLQLPAFTLLALNPHLHNEMYDPSDVVVLTTILSPLLCGNFSLSVNHSFSRPSSGSRKALHFLRYACISLMSSPHISALNLRARASMSIYNLKSDFFVTCFNDEM